MTEDDKYQSTQAEQSDNHVNSSINEEKKDKIDELTEALLNFLESRQSKSKSQIGDIQTRITTRLFNELRDFPIGAVPTKEERKLIDELYERVLANENIVLSRKERRQLLEQIIAELQAFRTTKAIETSFTLHSYYPSTTRLTPQFLTTRLVPYLIAVNNIQRTVDEVRRKEISEITIRVISQNSPISVSLNGAAEAIELIKESVTPWRRQHAEIMARLAEQEKFTEIENTRAEVLEKRSHAAKERAEADKLVAETFKERQKAERIRLENEKLRLELSFSKIQLVLDMLVKIAPNVSEADRIAYAIKLLPPIDTIISSGLEISSSRDKPG